MRSPWRSVGAVLRCRLDVFVVLRRTAPEPRRLPAEEVLGLLDTPRAFGEAVQAAVEARAE